MDLANEPVRAVPKPSFPRGKAKRSKRAEFSPSVRKEILKRDKRLCVRCKQRYDNIHHIVFRSAGGLGTVENGCAICHTCHLWAHSRREGREFFERYRDVNFLHREGKKANEMPY